MSAAMNLNLPSRSTVEEFIYHEAELLDQWKLLEWAELYTDDARYDIASLDSEDPLAADAATSLFVLSDDKMRITSRAKRLLKKTAHAEYPHSKTRHITSNVRIGTPSGAELPVRANFVVYRTKGDRTVQFMGEAHYVLVVDAGGGLKIRRKRINLDLYSLADQGRLTIIL
jgi:p-cumate 2,3-dioxygenase beta subunit